ncbi:hypothetical protein ACU4GD_37480 [Cupriavidus basilensis]
MSSGICTAHGGWGPTRYRGGMADGMRTRTQPRLPPGIPAAARRIAGVIALAACAIALPLALRRHAVAIARRTRSPAAPSPGAWRTGVGVHAHPRPTPPGRPLVAEPDPGEAGLAAELGRALGVSGRCGICR